MATTATPTSAVTLNRSPTPTALSAWYGTNETKPAKSVPTAATGTSAKRPQPSDASGRARLPRTRVSPHITAQNATCQ